MNNRPIGIFDSGVGGLTVVKEIIKRLPNEQIIYLGDTARVPYGTKSEETIKRFSIENARFLTRLGVKIIVVACNTSSSISLPTLRKRFNVPIIGVVKSGAEKAISATKNQRIGVIGTATTIKSKAYEKEIKKFSKKMKVISRPCPLFVPLVEEGWLNGKITLDVAKKYLAPFSKNKVDTLILGCTHYPLLKDVISRAMVRDVRVVDSASSVAEEVENILKKHKMLSLARKRPTHRFFATDAVEQFVRTGEKFLNRKIKNARRADYV